MNEFVRDVLDFQACVGTELFSAGGLAEFAADSGYRTAVPFPHLVLDNLFQVPALQRILQEWPAASQPSLELHDDGTFVRSKSGTTWKTPLGSYTRACFEQLAHPSFLRVLQQLTGIQGLLPDPYMFGGGLHGTAVGGKLAVHVDYNKHPVSGLDRRLNLLLYLNPGWTEANGGALELWNHEMSACVRRVLPTFNRTVLFTTFAASFHGQPEPVMGPDGCVRRSLALYYFSNGRPEEGAPRSSDQGHSTLWQQRPGHGY